jgi:hypothetical protein
LDISRNEWLGLYFHFGPAALFCMVWRRGGTRVFNRQAATLLKFAKVVADPGLAAGLVEKAADLKD